MGNEASSHVRQKISLGNIRRPERRRIDCMPIVVVAVAAAGPAAMISVVIIYKECGWCMGKVGSLSLACGGEMGSGETFTYAAAVEFVVAAREVHSFALVPLVVIPASEARRNGR